MTDLPEWMVCVSIPKKSLQVRYTYDLEEARDALVSICDAFKKSALDEGYLFIEYTIKQGFFQGTYKKTDTCIYVATFWIEAVPCIPKKLRLGEEPFTLSP